MEKDVTQFHVTRPILQPIKTSKTTGGREKEQWNEID